MTECKGGVAGAFGKVSAFVAVTVFLFVLLCWSLARVQGGGAGVVSSVGPERGEQIFWGQGDRDGTCHTCHSVGDRGTMTRAPNLEELAGLIGDRARARADKTSSPYTPTDYLVESVLNPNAYVVTGFPASFMPLVYRPPVSLREDDLRSVVAYLQTVTGSLDLDALDKAMRRFAGLMSRPPEVEPLDQRILGDADRGRTVFLSDTVACSRCHTIQGLAGAEGKVGPDLTPIGLRSLTYIFESIVDPAAVIVPGFGGILVDVGGGRQIIGVLRAETRDSLEVSLQDVAPLADRFEVVPEENLVRIPRKQVQRASLVTGEAEEDGHTHVVRVSPDLTNLASLNGRTGPAYTAAGKRHRHRIHAGVVGEAAGHTHTLSLDSLRLGLPQSQSIMPDNLADLLTVRQFRDLLAFLVTCKGATSAAPTAPAGSVTPAGAAAPSRSGTAGAPARREGSR